MKKYVLALTLVPFAGCTSAPKSACTLENLGRYGKDAYFKGYNQGRADAVKTAAKDAKKSVGPSNPANRFVEIVDESYPQGPF